jgi:ribonuclease E
MEMTRQRVRPSIEYTSYEPCKYCHGRGITPSVETLGLRFLRKLQMDSLKEKSACIRVVLPPEVADYLLNKKRKELLEIESRRECDVHIEPSAAMVPGDSKLVFE